LLAQRLAGENAWREEAEATQERDAFNEAVISAGNTGAAVAAAACSSTSNSNPSGDATATPSGGTQSSRI